MVFMQAANLAQHAIDAITEPQKTVFRLEMDIRRAAFHRIG